MAGEQHLHGELVARCDALNQHFVGGISLPWLQSQALRRRPSPAEHTTDACDFPYVTSRPNKTDREKKFTKLFQPNARNQRFA